MFSVRFVKALYCPDCDVIYSNEMNCPVCGNTNGCSMNYIRNKAAKMLEKFNEIAGERKPENFNQVKLGI